MKGSIKALNEDNILIEFFKHLHNFLFEEVSRILPKS